MKPDPQTDPKHTLLIAPSCRTNPRNPKVSFSFPGNLLGTYQCAEEREPAGVGGVERIIQDVAAAVEVLAVFRDLQSISLGTFDGHL